MSYDFYLFIDWAKIYSAVVVQSFSNSIVSCSFLLQNSKQSSSGSTKHHLAIASRSLRNGQTDNAGGDSTKTGGIGSVIGVKADMLDGSSTAEHFNLVRLKSCIE